MFLYWLLCLYLRVLKVISTTDAITRREDTNNNIIIVTDNNSFNGYSETNSSNSFIGAFFGSHFYQSLKFRQVLLYYFQNNSRICKVSTNTMVNNDNSQIILNYNIDVSSNFLWKFSLTNT